LLIEKPHFLKVWFCGIYKQNLFFKINPYIMAKAVKFYKEEIDAFSLKMALGLGFKRMHKPQVISLIKKGLAPFLMERQKGKEGVETCLYWTSPCRNFIVYVWLSYVEAQGETRNQDLGWVPIFDKRENVNDVIYFRFPRRRTEGFLERLYEDAMVCQKLILEYWAPKCKQCDAVQTIELVKGNIFHEVQFACPNGCGSRHGDICQNIPDDEEGKHFEKLLLQDMKSFNAYRARESAKGITRKFERFERWLRKMMRQQKLIGEEEESFPEDQSPDDPLYYDGEAYEGPDDIPTYEYVDESM
jgi:hypothetical protein